jgi:LysR substrate binding domain
LARCSEDDSRVVMVAVDHPLARRSEVSLEDLADYEVRRSPDDPPEVAEASCPSTTPSGRPIVAADIPVGDVSELLLLVAQGRLVHPTTAPFAEHFRHADIAVVPIVDLPPSSSALCWLRGPRHPGRDAFLEAVRAESQLVADGDARKSLPYPGTSQAVRVTARMDHSKT